MRKKKVVLEKVDGLGPIDIKKLDVAIRKVWSWSYARRLVVARCLIKDGFSKCEICKKKCPKVFVDHIDPVGKFDVKTFIERMFLPSTKMQGACKKCHDKKTKEERSKK